MTARLLRDAGIRPGMHVLDVGSGAGDVSLIAAELIGPSDAVTGVDRDGPSVELAGRRARAAGLTRVQFRQATVEEFAAVQQFDAGAGRYVLIHQDDPPPFSGPRPGPWGRHRFP